MMTSGAQQQVHGVKQQQKQKEIMSPLASFLCIHEILKEQVISLVGSSSSNKNTTSTSSLLSSSSNTKSSSSSSNTIHHPSLSSTKYYPLEKSFQMLSQLMDPTFLLNATSVSAANTTNTSVTAKSNSSSSLSHHHVNKKRKTSTSTSSTTTRKRSMSQILRNALRQGQEDVEMLAGVGTKDNDDDDDDILPPSPPHGFFTSFFSSSSSRNNNNNDSNTEDATGTNGDAAVTNTSNNNQEDDEDEDMADIPDDDDDNEGKGAKQEQVVQADSSNNNDDVIISLDNTEVLSVDDDDVDDEDDLSEINHEEEDEIEVMDEDAQDVDDDDDDDIDIDIEVDDEDEDHHNDPEDMPDMYYQMFQYLDTNKQRTSSARSRSSLSSRVTGSPNTISKKSSNNNNDKATALNERKQAYLLAGMQILESQYPPHAHHNTAPNNNNNSSNGATTPSSSSPYSPQILLSPQSEQSLLQSMCNIIRPPPKPIHLKVFLRRAPTQEEFFRGSLTKNPIPLSLLKGKVDPTFSDLRSHIANDLQMADSAELLELLVVGKIIPIHFKVRVVQETLWRKHVLENTSSSGSSSSRNREDGYTSDIETSLLPPMTVTYRLAGVDGEATEDIVEESDVIDPRQQQQHEEGSPSDDNTKEAAMEKEFAITKTIMSPNEKKP